MSERVASKLSMFCVELALACRLFSQVPSTSAPETAHHLAYPSDSFSLTLPTGWVEIDSRILAQILDNAKKTAPNLPAISLKYGFKVQSAGDLPRVAVALSDDHLSDETFANINGPHQSLDAYLDGVEKRYTGGTLQKSELNNLFYDKSRHVLWAISHSSYSDVGNIETLSAAFITKVGTIQLHCASKASEFARYEPVFRRIVESVVIDSKVALPTNH